MRVLFFCGDPGVAWEGTSGASVHVRADVTALRELGHEVDVALLGPMARRRGWLTEPHEWWSARRMGRKWASGVSGRPAAVPDLLYERHSLFCDAGRRLARRTGARHVVEVNAPFRLERDLVRFQGWARRVERRVLLGADRVVVVSEWLRNWAIEDVGCDPRRVVHVAPGCEARRGDRDGTRARWGLRGLVLGFVGSMRPWHGAAAVPALLDALPEATALVVGDGPYPPPPHERLVRTGHVRSGYVPDLVAAMDVAVVPVSPPPWCAPLKLADYRAQGVPVVARDGRSVSDWADDVRRTAGKHDRPEPRPWTVVLSEAIGP